VQALRSVPYDLMSPTSPATTEPAPQADVRPRVYLVRDDLLVPVPASARAAESSSATVAALLERLALGPQEDERTRGLSSALGPDVVIGLVRLEGTTAVVDVRAGAQLPSAGRLPLAVGQIVLTAVSVPGVDRVQLTAEGKPVQAPLPDGALTDRPLSAPDYASLVAGAPTVARSLTPTASASSS
jgi:spore germination protein GerM